MIENLKEEHLPLHGVPVAEKTAYARALLDNVCLQWSMKKVLKEEDKTAQLLTAK